VRDQHDALGTIITVTVYDASGTKARDAVEVAFSRIEEIESVVSLDDASSELSELNRQSHLAAASDELVEMLRLAFLVHKVSDGAFDVTTKPLLDLWRFDSREGPQSVDPAPAVQSDSVVRALRHVGMARILLGGGRSPSVSLVPGTIVDLSGVANGYAVDAAVDALHEAGIEQALVQTEDAARAIGGMPDGSPWVINLARPNAPSESVTRLGITDGAAAVAGGWRSGLGASEVIEPIIDPRSGFPTATCSSATIIAPTCAEAEALANAVSVLGPASGIKLIEGFKDLEALVIEYSDGEIGVHRSSGFGAFEKWEQN
jgi:thiamine biosynthesis lipoprotein